MSERLETLKKARECMIEERDAHVKVLAAAFDWDKMERARNKFAETQMLIEALERTQSNELRPRLEPCAVAGPLMSDVGG